ncbi:MAG: metallophosphoesterase [Bacteriovoracia bacterium]
MEKEKVDFKKATHTFVVSDIHLTTAEPVNQKDPLWKRFKQRRFFIDSAFETFLKEVLKKTEDGPVELVMAGDIFDFDGVTQLPKKNRFYATWLEKLRGLNSEEHKSRFKMRMIIQDHPVFFKALGDFIRKGNHVVFIIGNHDIELHWTSVQKSVMRALKIKEEDKSRIRFTNWFYISNEDTLIEHGNQYDSHCACQNTINPRIRGINRERIRIPFGGLANRYMLNGMGYFNPHSDRSYIMTFGQYIKFAVKNLIRREPFIMWTWFWGAIVTLIMTFNEGLSPAVKNPLEIEDQVEDIAKKSNATPRMVRELREIHVNPSFMDPLGVARELWLDRAFLILAALFIGFEVLDLINIVWKVSYWWALVVFAFFIPFFIFYFRSFKSKVMVDMKFYEEGARLGAKIAKVKRVIYGHTHEFKHMNFEGVEYLNSGTWSPAFDDLECTKPSCPKTFVWISPDAKLDPKRPTRVANVFEWSNNEMKLLC